MPAPIKPFGFFYNNAVPFLFGDYNQKVRILRTKSNIRWDENDINQKSADLIWCKLEDFNHDKTVN
jgi:hypothetical protein